MGQPTGDCCCCSTDEDAEDAEDTAEEDEDTEEEVEEAEEGWRSYSDSDDVEREGVPAPWLRLLRIASELPGLLLLLPLPLPLAVVLVLLGDSAAAANRSSVFLLRLPLGLPSRAM